MLSGKKAYICSPLSAPDAKGVSHNMDMARFYMERMQFSIIAGRLLPTRICP